MRPIPRPLLPMESRRLSTLHQMLTEPHKSKDDTSAFVKRTVDMARAAADEMERGRDRVDGQCVYSLYLVGGERLPATAKVLALLEKPVGERPRIEACAAGCLLLEADNPETLTVAGHVLCWAFGTGTQTMNDTYRMTVSQIAEHIRRAADELETVWGSGVGTA